MIFRKVLENLCYYDKRNPDGDFVNTGENNKKLDPCYCDNCFYGRTELAEEIIRLRK